MKAFYLWIKKNNFHVVIKSKYIYLFSCLLLLSFSVLSQISPLYSEHNNYEQFVNPAITGRDLAPFVNLSRKQYLFGVKNSPYSTSLGASLRLGIFDFYNPQMKVNRTGILSSGRMGFGGLIMQEKNGPLNTYFAEFSYAYFLPLSHANSELSFGLSAQFLNYHLNKDILNPLDVNDPQISGSNVNTFVPESGAGIYYHDPQFYIGASVNDLLLSNNPLNSNNAIPNKRDYFFQTGYKVFLRRFEMEPSLYFAQIDNDPLYYYSQLKFYYMNNWIAIGYKSIKSMLFSLGLNLHRFYIAYAFEQSVSGMSSYFNGSHQIMLGMNIGLYEPIGLKKTGKK